METTTVNPLVKRTSNLKTQISSRLALIFAQSNEAKCWVKNKDVVGSALLQLHLYDQQCYCLPRCAYTRGLYYCPDKSLLCGLQPTWSSIFINDVWVVGYPLFKWIAMTIRVIIKAASITQMTCPIKPMLRSVDVIISNFFLNYSNSCSCINIFFPTKSKYIFYWRLLRYHCGQYIPTASFILLQQCSTLTVAR